MDYLFGVIAYILVGALIVSIDAYIEYRQNQITKFSDYNRVIAVDITLGWPVVVFWALLTGIPGVLFWTFKKIGGNPFLNIKEAVGARRRQKDSFPPPTAAPVIEHHDEVFDPIQ